MITVQQCRAARGLLGWTQQDLANAAGLSKTAINNFEKGHSDIKAESLRAIRRAFEALEIEFMGEFGLQKSAESIKIFKGMSSFDDLMHDISETLKQHEGEILLSTTNVHFWNRLPSDRKEKPESMAAASLAGWRILCPEGTAMRPAMGNLCRWLPRKVEQAAPSLFIYGSKLALELWDQAMIVVINSPAASAAERRRFEYLWQSSATPSARKSKTADPLRDGGC
jgi:transcriptional regulator with XRE-family HTH domain